MTFLHRPIFWLRYSYHYIWTTMATFTTFQFRIRSGVPSLEETGELNMFKQNATRKNNKGHHHVNGNIFCRTSTHYYNTIFCCNGILNIYVSLGCIMIFFMSFLISTTAALPPQIRIGKVSLIV
jgi:hypothetical protein